MSNKAHCIVIMYNGKDIPEQSYKKIMGGLMEVLVSAGICVPELASITYKDTEGLASSLARDILLAKENKVTPITEDPVENALIYISERYRKELDQPNIITLVVKLSNDLFAHKEQVIKGMDGDILLMNALEIVCTNGIKKSMLTKHKISERAMNTIRDCYEFATV